MRIVTRELDTGQTRYCYYLVWITELPPDATQVEIGDVQLFQDA